MFLTNKIRFTSGLMRTVWLMLGGLSRRWREEGAKMKSGWGGC